MVKVAILLLLSFSAAFAADLAFELDPSQTQIHWTAGTTLHTVHGTFPLKRGTVHFDPSTGKAGGEIVIDLRGGQSGNGPRDRKMHKDVLQSDRFPEAVFHPERIEGNLTDAGSKLTVHGTFNIHGADHELALNLTVDKTPSGYGALTRFAIPYVSWGMKNPGNMLLRVDDTVQMEVRSAARALTAASHE